MRNGLEVNERMLFHGTSNEFVEAICSQNFDWRINGAHATVYGKGKPVMTTQFTSSCMFMM